jgi:protein-S-isoprenylcysteine O-methyltransferase Ste14
LSVEHLKLQELYGLEKGAKVGEIYGLISGWGLFFFWMGMWVSPQPRFSIPLLRNLSVLVPIVNFSIPLFHLIIFIFFLVLGAWLAIKGLIETTLRVAETHRTEKIIARGVYSVVRHPQYLGGLLSHVGISFLFSAWYSLLLTPLMVIVIYLISKKEEEELIKEFGIEYKDYKKKVPMLIPKLSR